MDLLYSSIDVYMLLPERLEFTFENVTDLPHYSFL